MTAQSKIEWTDSTWNPWIGCTKISPACDHCYAEAQMDTRMGRVEWGAGKPRSRTSAAYWKQPLRWNARIFWQCDTCGWRGEGPHLDGLLDDNDESVRELCPQCWPEPIAVKLARRRVFCASLADWLDNEAPIDWLADLLSLIAATPNLDWLLLSKRIGNWRARIAQAEDYIATRMLNGRGDNCGWTIASNWLAGEAPRNVWLGATVVNQVETDRDVPKLLSVPAKVRFLSIEPMLGPVDLMPMFEHRADAHNDTGVHWVICGGESGPHARPMHPDWPRSLRDQCAAAGVPFSFKQWGEWRPPCHGEEFNTVFGMAGEPPAFIVSPNGAANCFFPPGDPLVRTEDSVHKTMLRVGKRTAGRLLDGVEYNGFPVPTQ